MPSLAKHYLKMSDQAKWKNLDKELLREIEKFHLNQKAYGWV